MKEKIAIFLIAALTVFAAAFLVGIKSVSRNGTDDARQDISSNEVPVSSSGNADVSTLTESGENAPLNWAKERVTKKPFGIFITPQNSPVQPERFRGYHTGADFETLSGEEDTDISVYAICSGRLRIKQYIGGYGGVAIQDCQIKEENVTVIYGHLSLESVKHKAGSEILEIEKVGILGDPAKGETDGERKHLHLGIHKGSDIDLRGYVSSPGELADWIDPCLYFCQ